MKLKLREKDNLIAQETSKATHFENEFLKAEQYAR